MEVVKAYRTETVIQGLLKSVVVTIEVDSDSFYREHTGTANVETVWIRVTAQFSDLMHFEGSFERGQVHIQERGDILRTVADYAMVENAIEDLKAQTLQGIPSIQSFLGES